MRKIIEYLIYNNIVKILTIYKKKIIKENGFASDTCVEICFKINELANLIDEYREE